MTPRIAWKLLLGAITIALLGAVLYFQRPDWLGMGSGDWALEECSVKSYRELQPPTFDYKPTLGIVNVRDEYELLAEDKNGRGIRLTCTQQRFPEALKLCGQGLFAVGSKVRIRRITKSDALVYSTSVNSAAAMAWRIVE